jgi:hypothetical protein
VQERYSNNKHKDLVVKPTQRAPSIPVKKLGSNFYTGLGQDTVGPALYDASEKMIRQKTKYADFNSTKVQRNVFEPNITRDNNLPSRENPGPGQYDSLSPNLKRQFHSEGSHAIFLSKVPNCKDVKIKNKNAPGPGYYEKTSQSNYDTIGLENTRSSLEGGGI